MARPETGQDEFVDLYNVLEIPENATIDEIRKRINALYIEAQQNLDHRNVKKRLQFQQMYEIYLPQARHLLMDAARRAEYDRYLRAFRTGSKVEPASKSRAPVRSRPEVEGESGGTSGHESDGLPELVEQVDPEQLAAEREAMWAKWKTGLETVSASTASDLPGNSLGNSAAQTPSTPSVARARPAPVVPRFQPPAPSNRAASATVRPGAPRAPGGARMPTGAPETPQTTAQASEAERRREQQRYRLIKDSVQNAGLVWGIGTAAAAFLVGCILLLWLDNMVKKYPFGMAHGVFTGLCFLVLVLISLALGALARKRAKRRTVAELSVLSMEELMRRSG